MIKVMLIEDEPEIRKLLRKIVEKQEDFEIVSEADTFAGAVTEYTKFRPEVVFTDIDLAGEDGLECAKVLTAINPKVKIVFATAHSEYMANAFEIYAFDYIVKPFDIDRVVRTLNRIRDISSEARPADDNRYKGTGMSEEGGRLLIKGRDRVDFVDISEILLAERSESLTEIVTSEETFKTSVSLSDIEQRLPKAQFMRSHKSYIINMTKITKIEPYGRWTYVLKLKGTERTALITSAKYDELKVKFGI